jgi:hypothetical protein
MKKIISLHLKAAALALIFLLTFQAHGAEPQTISSKDDYVTCWKQPCVYVEGSQWSESHPNAVGVSVRMGNKPVVTDDQIKEVLSRDLAKHGVTDIKFFFEQNDVPASLIAFHVRGGTEGVFLIDSVRDEVAGIAKRAKNTNPLFQ